MFDPRPEISMPIFFIGLIGLIGPIVCSQIRFKQLQNPLVFVGPTRGALEAMIFDRMTASSQFSFRNSISRWTSLTVSWKWTFTSTMPWQISSAPFNPSAK